MNDNYEYSYEYDYRYYYPNSDVLRNKLNITNVKDLYDAELELVAYQTTNLMQKPIRGNFDFAHLKAIHKRLFEKVYEWAGFPRTCAIAKTNLFCLPEYIDSFAKEIFDKLVKDKYFIEHSYDEKIYCLVNLFADINALHPFREGNGRSQREYIEELAKINGIDLDLTSISKTDMIIVSHESINGNNEKLIEMFKNNAKQITKEEQLKYINIYCTVELKKELTSYLN